MPTVMFVPRLCVPLLEGDFSLISIGDPKQEDEFAQTHPTRLRIECHDIEEPILDEDYIHFTYFMAMKIVLWLEERRDSDVVIHCEGGISRSVAVAKFMREALGYEKKTFERCSPKEDGYNALLFQQLRIAQMDRNEAIKRIAQQPDTRN